MYPLLLLLLPSNPLPMIQRYRKSVPISNNKKEQTNKLEYTGIQKSGLRPTEIGIAIISSMKKYIPNIVSTSLTRDMETQLEQIESGNTTSCTSGRKGKKSN